jgi:plastocyanin
VVPAILLSTFACGSSSSPSPSPTPIAPGPPAGGPAASVTIPVGAQLLGDRAFVPAELEVAVGTTVQWRNTDAVSHTTTSNGSGWNSGTLGPTREFSFTFQSAGRFPYRCTIHPNMVGTVVVR